MKVCVIGMGPIGHNHARIYQSIPEVQLVGVCDRIEERASLAGSQYGVAAYLDAQKMLDELKPDLVSVATGGFEYASDHYEPTMQALHAGAHVMCEKPISNDLVEAEEMVRTAKERGLCLAVDLNHRFTPAARTAKQWQLDGRLGELLFINMHLWIGKFGDFETEFYHLKALNPHSVDIVRYFGGDVARVQCFAKKASGRNLYSTQSMNLLFENGTVGHITSSYDIKRGHPMERCEVAGTNGRLVVDDMWREATLYPADDLVKQVYTNPVFDGFTGFFDTFADRITAFVREILAGVKPEDIDGSGHDGLEASRVIHAAIESIRRGGQPVDVASVRQ